MKKVTFAIENEVILKTKQGNVEINKDVLLKNCPYFAKKLVNNKLSVSLLYSKKSVEWMVASLTKKETPEISKVELLEIFTMALNFENDFMLDQIIATLSRSTEKPLSDKQKVLINCIGKLFTTEQDFNLFYIVASLIETLNPGTRYLLANIAARMQKYPVLYKKFEKKVLNNFI